MSDQGGSESDRETASPGPDQSSRRFRTKRWRRVRTLLVGLLVFLSVLSLVVGAVAVWVHETVFDTDRYVALVGPMAGDPAVTEALATYTTAAVFDALQLQTRLQSALPDGLDVLAGPVTNAARDYVHDAADTFFRSERFQQLWVQINTVAHEKVVALLRGDYAALPNVTITGGEVRLNTIPIIGEVLRQLASSAAGLFGFHGSLPQISSGEAPDAARQRLAQALGVSLPEDFGQITIMKESNLTAVQDVVRWFDRLIYVLIGLSALLIALTLALSLNRRRTLVELGIGVVIGLLLFRAITRLVEKKIVEAVTNPEARGAARDVVARVVTNLRGAGVWLLLAGLLIAIIAYLVGGPRWFKRSVAWTRGTIHQGPSGSELEHWVHAHIDWVRGGGIGLAALILFFTGVDWVPVIVVGLLLAAYLGGLATIEHRAISRMQESPSESSTALSDGGGLPPPVQG
jgi:hypothetical protein